MLSGSKGEVGYKVKVAIKRPDQGNVLWDQQLHYV